MATKKEKRLRALASREAFMKQYREDGEKALKADQDRRQREKDDAINEAATRQRGNLKARAEKFSKIAQKARREGRIVEDFTKEEITVGEYLDAANTFFAIDVTDKLTPAFSDR